MKEKTLYNLIFYFCKGSYVVDGPIDSSKTNHILRTNGGFCISRSTVPAITDNLQPGTSLKRKTEP
jgi:hypothetical protein